MVLGFEIRRYYADYGVESWLWICGEQSRMQAQELRESGCGECAFSGYIEGAAGESLG